MVVKSGNFIIKGFIFFILHGKKQFAKYINYHYRTHNISITHIIQCYHIDIILENIFKIYKVYMGINE